MEGKNCRYRFRVIDIKLSLSICGLINIGIHVEENGSFQSITTGDSVYMV